MKGGKNDLEKGREERNRGDFDIRKRASHEKKGSYKRAPLAKGETGGLDKGKN